MRGVFDDRDDDDACSQLRSRALKFFVTVAASQHVGWDAVLTVSGFRIKLGRHTV